MWTFEEDRTRCVLTAREHIQSEHRGEGGQALPGTAVLFFLGRALEYVCRTRGAQLLMQKLPRFLSSGDCPVYALDGEVCCLDGGRGAPQAVDTLETLAAMGVKRVISVGLCGAFSNQVAVGDLIVPDRAFVEEGTSLHYYGQIEYAEPDRALFERLRAMRGAKVFPVVSTDGLYRQTFFKEARWRERGAVGVDMETSALFSVGRALGIPVASVLMASDLHPQREDEPRWAWKLTEEMRRELCEQVMGVLGR